MTRFPVLHRSFLIRAPCFCCGPHKLCATKPFFLSDPSLALGPSKMEVNDLSTEEVNCKNAVENVFSEMTLCTYMVFA